MTRVKTVRAKTVEGIIRVACVREKDGLAVTPALPEDAEFYGPWNVTHVLSGCVVARARSQRKARILLGALLPITDWNRSARDLFLAPDLEKQIEAIKELHGAWR